MKSSTRANKTDIFILLVIYWFFFFIGFATLFLAMMYVGKSVNVLFAFLAGTVMCVISIFYRKRLLSKIVTGAAFGIIVYAAYMIGVWGMFMGVPVCNILPGFMYAIIAGRKIETAKMDKTAVDKLKTQVFAITSIGLWLAFALSAYIALSDPYTGKNLQGMLRLQNEVSVLGIVLIIVIGGISLYIIQALSIFGILRYFIGKTGGQSGGEAAVGSP